MRRKVKVKMSQPQNEYNYNLYLSYIIYKIKYFMVLLYYKLVSMQFDMMKSINEI
jgi:hypothetical protein